MKLRPSRNPPPADFDGLRNRAAADNFEWPPAVERLLTVYGGAYAEDFELVFTGGNRAVERIMMFIENGTSGNDFDISLDIEMVTDQIGDRLLRAQDDDYVFVPFLQLFGGDYACLDNRENPNSPSLVVWDHELSEDDAPVVHTIAESAQNYIANVLVQVESEPQSRP